MKFKYPLITFVLFFSLVAPAYASEVTGQVSTGVSTGSNVGGVLMVVPTATPNAGAYSSTQSVVLSGGAGTQSIHYTTDNTGATCTNGSVYTTTPVAVATSLSISAISCYPNGSDSGAVNFPYVISTAATPNVSSGGGGGGGGASITVSDNADFNNDGTVNILDLNILASNWGSTNATHLTGDANGDGKVNILDLNILATQWSI